MSNTLANPANDDKLDDEIDLASLFLVLLRFKWLILMICCLVTASAAWYASTLPPVYRASATMLLEVNEVKTVSIEEIYGLDSSRQEYFQTQYEILKSRHLAQKVVDHLQLAYHPDFQQSKKPSLIKRGTQKAKRLLGLTTQKNVNPVIQEPGVINSSLVSDFISRLKISPINKTQLVSISFESKDPHLAAQVVNTLGELYISSHTQEKMKVTLQASDWIKTRLDELKVKLQQSESDLQDFREANDLIDVTGVVTLVSQELNELTSQLGQARQIRTQAQAAISFLKEQNITDVERLAALPLFAENRSIQGVKKDLQAAEIDFAALSKRYGPKHNKMLAAKARLEDTKLSLAKLIKRLADGLKQEHQAALENERELNLELSALKQRFQDVSRLETQYRVLNREMLTNRQLYDTFLTRLKETGAAGDFQPAHARFTDKAEPPRSPVKPKKMLIVALAFVGSLMMGMMLVLVFELLNGTIKSPSDVEQYLGLRVLGITPKLSPKGANKLLPVDCFYNEDTQAGNEVWRTLRTGYLLTHHGLTSKVVAVTSTIPSEGKSTTSINLGYALSQVEKVLLVEADLRRPTFAKRFGLPPNQPGLFNVLAGTHSIHECLYKEPRSGMNVLVAGTQIAKPLELLTSTTLKRVMSQLKSRYDRIVIDTPPVHVVSDALLLAKISDSFLYVVRAENVHHKQAKEGLDKLRRLNVKIDGVVLNKVSKNETKSYYGYKYDGYYSYENEGAIKPAPALAELIQLPVAMKKQPAQADSNRMLVSFDSPANPAEAFINQLDSEPLPLLDRSPKPVQAKRRFSENDKFQLHLEKVNRAMVAKDFVKARKHLTYIHKLKMDLPLSFYYRMAYAMYMSGEKKQAQKAASYYIKKAGKSGKYYEQARKLVG